MDWIVWRLLVWVWPAAPGGTRTSRPQIEHLLFCAARTHRQHRRRRVIQILSTNVPSSCSRTMSARCIGGSSPSFFSLSPPSPFGVSSFALSAPPSDSFFLSDAFASPAAAAPPSAFFLLQKQKNTTSTPAIRRTIGSPTQKMYPMAERTQTFGLVCVRV